MVFPPRNLPGDAEKWGRAIEEALGNIDKTARIASQMSDNTTRAVDGVISAGSDTKLELNYEVQRNEETREKLAAAEELIADTRVELEEAQEGFDTRFEDFDDALGVAQGAIAQAQTDLGNLGDDLDALGVTVHSDGSRGDNFIRNANGFYGLEGFEGWFLETAGEFPPGAVAAFSSEPTRIIPQDIPIDPSKRYLTSVWVKKMTPEAGGRFYLGLTPYDVEGSLIQTIHYMELAGTRTTLTQDLEPGDTEVHVESTANWHDGSTNGNRRIIFWNYVDGRGREWQPGEYSRNVSGASLWNPGTLTPTTIPLVTPWAGPTYPAGTVVGNASAGGNYMYAPGISNVLATEEWTLFQQNPALPYTGVHTDNTRAAASAFPVATAYARMIVLIYDQRDMWFTNFRFSGVDAAQSAAEAAQAAASSAQTAAGNAQTAASNAQDVADQAAQDLLALAGRTGRVIRSGTEPTGDDRSSNNLWLNTATGQLHEWDGSEWSVITDDRLTAAANAADAAANAAANAATAASNAQSTADDAASAAATAGSDAAAAQATATAAQSAASSAQADASAAQSAASTAQSAADQAALDAAAAAGIAASKGDVLIQGTAPATAMRKATTLWIDTTGGANTPKRWSGSAWVAVTDKAATDAANAAAAAQGTANSASSAAAAAQSTADSAGAAAAGAQSAADAAMGKATTADGRYTVATANPTTADASGKPIGAVWEVRSGGTALRRYVLTGATTWTQVKVGQDFIGAKAIGQAQIGDAAVGTAQIADLTVTNAKLGNLSVDSAKVSDLDGDKINARTITAEKLVIGSSENLIPNGSGEFRSLGGWATFANMTNISWETDDAPTGLPGYVRFDKTGTRVTAGAGVLVDVEPGAEYLFEAYIRADVAGSRLYLEFRDDKGAHATDNYFIPGYPSGNGAGTGNPGPYPIQNREVPTAWTRVVGRTVVKPGVNKIRVGSVYVNHSNGTVTDAVVDIAGLRLQKRASAELIVDGSITAAKVQAQSVAAAVGVFIDAMMENLTVTGVANLDLTVTNELYTKMAVVDKLQALSEIITHDMIATGAVTAENITVTEDLTAAIAQFLTIYAEDVNVGRDARWWSGGLVFYAPPAQGQDPEDWENRTPLIVLTPTGDVSISVAKEGEVTAGMTSDGEVFAHLVSADEISLAGESLDDALQRGPRGLIGAATSSNFLSVNTATSPYLSLNFTPEAGRMYEIEFAVRGGAQASQNERLTQQIRQARPGQSATHSTYSRELGSWVNFLSQPASTNYSFRNAVIVSGDELLSSANYRNTDNVVTIWTTLSTRTGAIGVNSGGNADRAMPPHLTITDIGEARPISVQTVSAVTPPPPAETWYGPVTIKSSGSWGVRPNGTNAIDPRLTLGGYNIYGTDMAEWILYQFNFSRLTGSTVRAATVQLTVTQNAPVAFTCFAGTGPTTGHVALFTATANANGTISRELSSAARQALVGKTCLVLKPFYPGNTASYGYFAATANVPVIYSK